MPNLLETLACNAGCLHPDHEGYFATPGEYMKWYRSHGRVRDTAEAPIVAVMMYRKHVITNQAYIPQLIRTMEEEGVLPIPIFINGVEAHTVVRLVLPPGGLKFCKFGLCGWCVRPGV